MTKCHQASKDGCNTLPELEIGSLANDGIVRCSYVFSLTVVISFKAQVHRSCRIKVVLLIALVFAYTDTISIIFGKYNQTPAAIKT